MADKELTVKDIQHITVRELAFKIKSVDDYIGSTKGEEAASLRQPILSFFLGAGASFESKIMLAGQMMEIFKKKIFEAHCDHLNNDDEKAEWLVKQDWYECGKKEYGCLFEKAFATKTERQRFIENMIADKSPSFGYVVLADLFLKNYINTVLTTNFDDLVYIACTNYTGNRPIVYAYGILASEMKIASAHSKVLKLHGDYLYSNIVNTSEEMLKQSQALSEPLKDIREAINSLNMERQVRSVFDNFGVVVVGYSGGDETVMKLLESVSKDNGFYWCYRRNSPPDAEVLDLIKRKNGRLVEIEGFDALMAEISEIMNFKIEDLLDSLDQRKEKLKSDFTKFDSKYSKKSLDEYAEELKEEISNDNEEELTETDYLILGNQFEDKEDYESAEGYYLKAIEINPNLVGAYYNLGALLEKDKDRWKEAKKFFNKAIDLDPNDPDIYIYLGNLLSKDEKSWKEAEENYKKAIQLETNYVLGYYNLGVLLSKDESRWKEAKEVFNKAILVDRNYAVSYNGLGILLAKTEENWKEAEENYKKAIQLEPNDELTYNNLGLLLSKDKSRWAEAEDNFNKAIELNPNDPELYNNLGHFLTKDKSRWAEAEDNFNKAMELDSNHVGSYFNLACLRSLSKKEENKDEAFEFLRKAVELDSKCKEDAKTDKDFDFIRDDPRFKEIVGE